MLSIKISNAMFKFKTSLLIILLSFFFKAESTNAQAGVWTWIHGDSALAVQSYYVSQGVYDSLNHPAAFYEVPYWVDNDKCLWIYSKPNVFFSSGFIELWKYNPYLNQWMYVKSFSDTLNFGIKGVPAITNSPGNRDFCALTWVDNNSKFWMYGGGMDSRGDLWVLDTATLLWTWVQGSPLTYQQPHFGIKGVPSFLNTPGNMRENNATWVDSLNNLWLFGGQVDGGFSAVNHLWRFNTNTLQWTWMQGDTAFLNQGYYGLKNVPSPFNLPPTRYPYAKMKDKDDNAYIFGGWNISVNKGLNDVWKYQPSTNYWIWVGGTSVTGSSGNYPPACVPTNAAAPYSRCENKACATDVCGNLWNYGGVDPNQNTSLNDLWLFNPDSNQFRLLQKRIFINPVNYGIKGQSGINVKPPAAFGGLALIDTLGRFYIIGGSTPTNLSNAIFKFELNSCCIECVASIPSANFSASTQVLCEKGCVNFYDNSGCFPTQWKWIFNGAVPDTSTAQNPQSICYNSYGTFPVTLITSNNLGTDTTTITSCITVAPYPATPVVIQNADTLVCISAAASYQWFNNGIAIPGASQSVYITTQQGLYYVIITDSLGCSAPSNVIVLNGIQAFSNQNSITVSPNPTEGYVAITINLILITQKLEVTIINVLGEMVFEKRLDNVSGKFSQQVNLSTMPKGVYYLKVNSGEKTFAEKIILR